MDGEVKDDLSQTGLRGKRNKSGEVMAMQITMMLMNMVMIPLITMMGMILLSDDDD